MKGSMKKRSLAMLVMGGMMVSMLSLPSNTDCSEQKQSVSAAVIHDDDLVLRYDSMAGTYSKDNAWDNAESFYRALPLGNGRIGATVYGNCPEEWIDLNECTVWSSGPGENNHEGAANYLEQVQSLIAAGDYKTANSIISDQMIGDGQAKYQMVGTLKLNFGHQSVGDYRRQLDMNDAVTTTSYTHNGKQYIRETFVSHPDQVMVTRIRCNTAGSVSLSATYGGVLNGSASTDGNNVLVANGHGSDDLFVRGAVYFSTRSKFINEGGTVSASNNSVTVSNADSLLIVTSVRTNFINATTVNGDEKGDALKDIAATEHMTYDELYQRHCADYQALFHRVDVDLGGDSAVSNAKTIPQRIAEFTKTDDPKMVKVLFQYGRYLMISASRDAQAMNLQGIWNKYSQPAWGSKATTNINYEMNYWPAFTTNLAECFTPFVEKAKALQASGNLTAKVHYGIDEGWVLHHNTDLWNRTGPIDGSWGQWPVGGAWISNMLYDAYRFNQDEAYLEEIYPVIQGSAAFLNELMIKQTVNGQEYVGISPSASPELPIPGYAWNDNVYCSFSVTMDNSICRELFADVTEASAILKRDASFRSSLQSKLSLLRPETIGKWGQIQEWASDWDNPSEKHRHISHLYGVYPGFDISPNTNAAVAKAAETTLNGRGDAGTGWSEAWKLNCWARLCDGAHAYNLIRLLITPMDGSESGRLYDNLWDAHPPFQIDGNFGFTAGVAEMLVQSQNDVIHLLPALPQQWNTGHANGLCARGNFEITAMSWEDGKLSEVTILSNSGGTCHVRYGNYEIQFETEQGKEYRLNGNLQFFDPTESLMNLALHQTVTASGAAAGEDASYVADGNDTTKWCHMGGMSGEWVQIDLGSEKELSSYVVKFAGVQEEIQYNARDFRLQASMDGENWMDIDTVYGNTKSIYNKNLDAFSAQYIRLEMINATQDNSGGARVYELELWGDTEPPAPKNPYENIEAEDYDFMGGGIEVERNDNGVANIGFITEGSYVVYRNLDFENGAAELSVQAASDTEGGQIEIRLGSPTGELVGTMAVGNTDGWQTYQTVTCEIDGCTGIQDICLVFTGDSGYLLNLDSLIFTQSTAARKRGDVNCDGIVKIDDVVLLSRFLGEDRTITITTQGRSNADYNEDGQISADDSVAILRMLVGLS